MCIRDSSPEVRALLDLDKKEVSPPELMTAILKARVDGIGGTALKLPLWGLSLIHISEPTRL